MKYIKIFIFTIWLTILTVITGLAGFIGAAFTKGQSMRSFFQVLEFWKVVKATFSGRTKQVEIFLKSKKLRSRYSEPKMMVSIDAIDYAELFAFTFYSLYIGFYVSLIGSVILSAILYQAIYVSPVAVVVDTAPKTDVITYQKSNLEVNKDTYCPCTPLFKFESGYFGTNTIMIDQDMLIPSVSDHHVISPEQINSATIEKPMDFYGTVINNGYSINYEGEEIPLQEYQGFVFSNDLNSIFFFEGKNIKRIQLQ